MTALTTEPLTPSAAPSTSPSTTPLPALRLVPAPVSAPPYDDEVGGASVLRLVVPLPAPPVPVPFDEHAWLAPERTPTTALPESRGFARTLVQGLLEVLAGVRPVKQLQRDTTPEVYAALTAELSRRPRVTGLRPDHRAVRSVHVQERPEGIVEVCATVQRGTRLTAVALRLEGLDGRWRCTELVGV
jgi:hypothetical protein